MTLRQADTHTAITRVPLAQTMKNMWQTLGFIPMNKQQLFAASLRTRDHSAMPYAMKLHSANPLIG